MLACYLNNPDNDVIPAVKKSSASSLSLQLKTKCLVICSEEHQVIIISSEKMKRLKIPSDKNEAPHYFFRKKSSASLFLKTKTKPLLQEKKLIFFKK